MEYKMAILISSNISGQLCFYTLQLKTSRFLHCREQVFSVTDGALCFLCHVCFGIIMIMGYDNSHVRPHCWQQWLSTGKKLAGKGHPSSCNTEGNEKKKGSGATLARTTQKHGTVWIRLKTSKSMPVLSGLRLKRELNNLFHADEHPGVCSNGASSITAFSIRFYVI